MSHCAYHPEQAATGPCSQCGTPLCSACTVELLQRRLCGRCRDAWLAGLQSAVGPRPEVLAPGRRQALFARALGLLLFTLFGPVVLAVLALRWLFPGSWLPAGVGALIAFAVGMQWQANAMARFSARVNRDLRAALAARLRREGLEEVLADARFVGLSIGEQRQTYYGDNSWDVGFLLPGPGWLAYYGDQTRFTLHTHQVVSVTVDPPGDGGKLVDPRTLLRWRAGDAGGHGPTSGEVPGTLAFHPTEGDTRAAARASLVALADELNAWRLRPAPPLGQWVAPLPPRTGPTGGQAVPAAYRRPGSFWRALAIGVSLAVVAALASAGLRWTTGINLPIWGVIPVVIVLTNVLHEAWERRRDQAARSRDD
jgi:hypothetical protein